MRLFRPGERPMPSRLFAFFPHLYAEMSLPASVVRRWYTKRKRRRVVKAVPHAAARAPDVADAPYAAAYAPAVPATGLADATRKRRRITADTGEAKVVPPAAARAPDVAAPAVPAAVPADAKAASQGEEHGGWVTVRQAPMTFKIWMLSTDTVETFRQKIQDVSEVCPHEQRLIHRGTQLEDGRRLSDYGLPEQGFGDTVWLLGRLLGS